MAISQQLEQPLTLGQRLRHWKEVLDTCNLSKDKKMDTVSRWLIITRACVFQMTITSGLIGGLLAFGTPGFNGFYFALAVVGLVLAHAANNMINELTRSTTA